MVNRGKLISNMYNDVNSYIYTVYNLYAYAWWRDSLNSNACCNSEGGGIAGKTNPSVPGYERSHGWFPISFSCSLMLCLWNVINSNNDVIILKILLLFCKLSGGGRPFAWHNAFWRNFCCCGSLLNLYQYATDMRLNFQSPQCTRWFTEMFKF